MKQIKKNRNSVISMLIIGLMLVIGGAVFVACHQDERSELQDQGIDYPIPENAKVVTDLINIGFYGRVPQPNTDDIYIGFSAVPYYLPHNIKNYDKYVKMIESGGKYGTILKVTIGDEIKGFSGYPILKVEEPDPEEKADLEVRYSHLADAETGEPLFDSEKLDPKAVERYESKPREIKVDENIYARRSLSSSMTLSRAQSFFNQFKNLTCNYSGGPLCIPFQYAADGCYARAHYMRKLMADAGYDCQKIFVYADTNSLSANTKAGCCVEWGYHVAPLVRVDRGSYYQKMVIDPSLFDGPVPIQTWIDKMKENCKWSGIPTIRQAIVDGSIYTRSIWGRSTTDDDYSDTEDILRYYQEKMGCN